uniref:hypothetical protein n=1 Tax=Parabacteroides goldsteinii TaxID=328812 RepID=UPI0026E012CA
SAINEAKNDAKKNGNTANGVAVVIPVTPKEGQNSFNVTKSRTTSPAGGLLLALLGRCYFSA